MIVATSAGALAALFLLDRNAFVANADRDTFLMTILIELIAEDGHSNDETTHYQHHYVTIHGENFL
jgi:hypothetical protein